MSRKARLDELLKTGAMSPRAALDLLATLCDTMAGQPALGSDVLAVGRISFDGQGVLQLDRRTARPATEHDTRFALGALLFHLLLRVPWDEAIPKRQAQLDELRSQVGFWPDGGSVCDAVEELLGPGGFSGVRSKVEALRQRAAGPALGDWRDDAILSLSEGVLDRAKPQHVMSVDELTANIPVGAMMAQARHESAVAAAAAAGPVLQVTPAPGKNRPRVDPFEAPTLPSVRASSRAIPIFTALVVVLGMAGVFVLAVIAGLWLLS